MTLATEMNNIIEERYLFCIWLYRIKKETDIFSTISVIVFSFLIYLDL